jgi:hypothetical protein
MFDELREVFVLFFFESHLQTERAGFHDRTRSLMLMYIMIVRMYVCYVCKFLVSFPPRKNEMKKPGKRVAMKRCIYPSKAKYFFLYPGAKNIHR